MPSLYPPAAVRLVPSSARSIFWSSLVSAESYGASGRRACPARGMAMGAREDARRVLLRTPLCLLVVEKQEIRRKETLLAQFRNKRSKERERACGCDGGRSPVHPAAKGRVHGLAKCIVVAHGTSHLNIACRRPYFACNGMCKILCTESALCVRAVRQRACNAARVHVSGQQCLQPCL